MVYPQNTSDKIEHIQTQEGSHPDWDWLKLTYPSSSLDVLLFLGVYHYLARLESTQKFRSKKTTDIEALSHKGLISRFNRYIKPMSVSIVGQPCTNFGIFS